MMVHKVCFAPYHFVKHDEKIEHDSLEGEVVKVLAPASCAWESSLSLSCSRSCDGAGTCQLRERAFHTTLGLDEI